MRRGGEGRGGEGRGGEGRGGEGRGGKGRGGEGRGGEGREGGRWCVLSVLWCGCVVSTVCLLRHQKAKLEGCQSEIAELEKALENSRKGRLVTGRMGHCYHLQWCACVTPPSPHPHLTPPSPTQWSRVLKVKGTHWTHS